MASTEPRGLSASFLIHLTTEVEVSGEESGRGPHSEWPRDSSEARLIQCQEWHQYRLGRPHKEKVEESSEL